MPTLGRFGFMVVNFFSRYKGKYNFEKRKPFSKKRQKKTHPIAPLLAV